MKHETVTYQCDKCGVDLPGFRNSLNIVTSLNENSIHWSRLHVKIKLRKGSQNDSNTTDADLCQACAVELLKDALARVKKGERATAGTEYSNQQGWEE